MQQFDRAAFAVKEGLLCADGWVCLGMAIPAGRRTP